GRDRRSSHRPAAGLDDPHLRRSLTIMSVNPASTLPRYAHRRGTRGFAAIVTLLAGAVVLAAGTIAAPRAALDPAFVSWLVIGSLVFGVAHVVAAYGLIRRSAWSGVMVGYL